MDQGVDKDSICQTCGKNELVFAGPNTTEHFCQWLFSFLLNKCGKYPFLSSSNPSILGSSDNALGKKLMESIILTRHPGTSIYMFLVPLAIIVGFTPWCLPDRTQLNTFVNGCFPEKTKGSRLLHTISKATIHCPF
jgi:hypothetical protein